MLDFLHIVLVEENRTADHQTTTGLLNIIENDGNTDDLIAFIYERSLPVDDVQALQLAEKFWKSRLN